MPVTARQAQAGKAIVRKIPSYLTKRRSGFFNNLTVKAFRYWPKYRHKCESVLLNIIVVIVSGEVSAEYVLKGFFGGCPQDLGFIRPELTVVRVISGLPWKEVIVRQQ